MTDAGTAFHQAAAGPSTSSGAAAANTSVPIPAAPPSQSEIERKLSFKAPTRSVSVDSPKKIKVRRVEGAACRQGADGQRPAGQSGNESDTSSVISMSHLTSPTFPPSPLMTPASQGVVAPGGLSAIAEQQSRATSFDTAAFVEEEEGEDEGEESEELDQVGGELQRGMEGERVLKSGYLLKKQERRKAWKRRWFVLRTGKLAYYKDDREYSLKRVLDLRQVQSVAPVTVKKHSFAFGIVTSKRTFLAKASSQDEMDDWVRMINQARRKLSERHEEEHTKRTTAQPVPVPAGPARQPTEVVDVHQGTYGSVFSGTTGSYGSSPLASAGGYFAAKNPAGAQTPAFGEWTAQAGGPAPLTPSPLDMTNVGNQVSLMTLAASPSTPGATGPRVPQSRILSTSTRREPSASSVGSSDQYHASQGTGLGLQRGVSSDEEEAYEYTSDPAPHPLSAPASSAVDPNKIILSAYLMKRSKGTGRRTVWRKRWFYLTSQGLTYTKSHMDSRPIRFIPLSVVLDALEFDPDSSAEDGSDSDLDAEPAAPSRTFTSSKRGREGAPTSKAGAPGGADEHLFRICTATKTLVLCAPSEEDEIKWLAAFRALLSRQRERTHGSSDASHPASSAEPPLSPRLTLPPQGLNLPLITQQPPTPASLPTSPPASDPSSAAGGAQPNSAPLVRSQPLSPPIQTGGFNFPSSGAPARPAGRDRSATYVAKGAVADVVKRFHPETQHKDLPATPS